MSLQIAVLRFRSALHVRLLPRIIAGELASRPVYRTSHLPSPSRGNFLPLPPFGGGVVRPVSPVLRPKQRFGVSEVVVAVGDFSNTRHSNILRIDDFGTAPLALGHLQRVHF